MSVGSAKNARKASDIPSNSTRGRWSAASTNELTLEYLLSDVAHPRSCAHGGLLNDLESRGLIETAIRHQHLFGPLDDLSSLDLVVGARGFVRDEWLARRGIENRRELGQDLTASKGLHQIRGHARVASALDERTLTEGGQQHDDGRGSLQGTRDFHAVDAGHL